MLDIKVIQSHLLGQWVQKRVEICQINNNQVHCFLKMPQTQNQIFCKCRQMKDLQKITDINDIRVIIDKQILQLNNQIKMIEKIQSKFLLNYLSIYISYPYICFIHEPIHSCVTQFAREKKLNFNQKIDLMLSVSRGLKDLQSKKICIRTIRPQNIVVLKQSDQQFKICFSNYRYYVIFDDKEKQMKIPPKQINQYTAPEVLNKKPHNLSCDIWSLGLILYQIYFNIKYSKQNEIPQGTPQWIKNLFSRMIYDNPIQRHKINDVVNLLQKAKFSYSLLKRNLYSYKA